jgi:hypothetical protein
MPVKIQVRRGTAPITTQLDVGELGFRTDTGELAIGTGVGSYAIRIITQKYFSSSNSILVANTAEVPVALSLGANTVVGRLSGNISALTGSDLWTIINGQNNVDIDVNNKRVVNVANPAGPSDAVNKSYVDTLVARGLTYHEAVLSKNLTAPPASPNVGDRYWIAPNATGAWAGHDYQIATWNGSAWEFEAVTDGDCAFVTDENIFYYYDAGATGDKRKQLSTAMGPHAYSHYANGTDPIDVKDLADSENNLLRHAFTAKGQILVGTGSGTYTALPVGSDGQVLVVDSTQASGVKWATISSGGGGSSTFIDLTDTPSSYTGYAGYLVAVKSTADGLEFINVIDGGTL